MKIISGSVTMLASEGRITMQVPNLAFGEPSPELLELPDEYFWKLTSACFPTESDAHCLFLSPTGWKHFRDAIKEAFEASDHKRGTWKEFEEHATGFFSRTRKKRDRKIASLQRSINKLKAFDL